MQTVYLLCTVIGGTILVLQVVLSLLGLGLDHFHLGDFGGHVADVASHNGGLGHPSSFDTQHNAEAGGEMTSHGDHEGLMKLGRMLTFQTIVAFVAFFGVGGLAALENGSSLLGAIPLSIAAGLSAMFAVAFLFGSLRRLHGDGSLRMEQSPGSRGRVYLTIPGQGDGLGKVTVTVQGREVELAARTPGPELRSGDEVVVSRVLDEGTVEVVAAASYMEKPLPLY